MKVLHTIEFERLERNATVFSTSDNLGAALGIVAGRGNA